jgi:hypothetical protein
VKFPSFLTVTLVSGVPAVQLPVTGVAVKVPLIVDPFRKPLVTFPERVNLRAVLVACRLSVPEDFIPLFAFEWNVPDAEPETQVRLLDVIATVPLTLEAGGDPTGVHPLAERVPEIVWFPFGVKSSPGEMVFVDAAFVHVVDRAAGLALATPTPLAPIPTNNPEAIANPAAAAAHLRVRNTLVPPPLLAVAAIVGYGRSPQVTHRYPR